MNAVKIAELAGIDFSLIDENLRLTPEQRALQHQSALETTLQLEAAYHVSLSTGQKQKIQATATPNATP